MSMTVFSLVFVIVYFFIDLRMYISRKKNKWNK